LPLPPNGDWPTGAKKGKSLLIQRRKEKKKSRPENIEKKKSVKRERGAPTLHPLRSGKGTFKDLKKIKPKTGEGWGEQMKRPKEQAKRKKSRVTSPIPERKEPAHQPGTRGKGSNRFQEGGEGKGGGKP